MFIIVRYLLIPFAACVAVLPLIGCNNPTSTIDESDIPPFDVQGMTYRHPTLLRSEVGSGTTVEADVVLTNLRPAPLTVRLEALGCSCSKVCRLGGPEGTAELVEIGQVVALAGHATLPLRVSMRVSPIADHLSAVSRFVVHDEAGRVHSFDTSIRVDIQPDISASPSVLSERLKQAGPRTVTTGLKIDVYSREESAEELTMSLPTGVTLTALRADPAKRQPSGLWLTRRNAEFSVSRPTRDADLPLTGSCVISLRNHPDTRLTVPVTLRLGEGLTTSPDDLFLSDATAQKSVVRRIRITAEDGVAFRITNVTSDSAVLTVASPLALEAGEQQWLELQLTPETAGIGRAIVRISTDHPNKPILDLPVRFDAKEK